METTLLRWAHISVVHVIHGDGACNKDKKEVDEDRNPYRAVRIYGALHRVCLFQSSGSVHSDQTSDLENCVRGVDGRH
jgi:hypothetical protein